MYPAASEKDYEKELTMNIEILHLLEGADHAKGTAVVILTGDISDDVLKKAVEEQDYEVKSIK